MQLLHIDILQYVSDFLSSFRLVPLLPHSQKRAASCLMQ